MLRVNLVAFMFLGFGQAYSGDNVLTLNDLGYFETRGLNVMVFNNWYNDYFGDSKITGVEIIHHDVRTATNGDVRLSPTPEQWDLIPKLVERKVNRQSNSVEVLLKYPAYEFDYTIKAEARGAEIVLSVNSFIAGGVVPGVLIVAPDFPENKEDWPFLWGENEYVIGVGASYIFAVNAVDALLNGTVAGSQQ